MDRECLLVLDDEPTFAEFVRRVASGIGYRVAVTGDAAAFKEAYSTLHPGTIVLDVVMPEVDGIEIVRWLARQDCRARVLMITGHNPRYAHAALAFGSAQGMELQTHAKPISVAALRAALGPL